jgi:hypothetical protein
MAKNLFNLMRKKQGIIVCQEIASNNFLAIMHEKSAVWLFLLIFSQ